MTSRSAQLAARREALVARSEYLRGGLASGAVGLAGRLRFVDTATAFLRSGSGRVLLCGGAALLLLVRPGRALKIASRLTVLWPFVRPWLPRALGFKRERD